MLSDFDAIPVRKERGLLGKMAQRLGDFWAQIKLGWGQAPIRERSGLVDFLASRAAHVAQSALYGYLQTRMGTRWRVIFQDEEFQPSLDAARQRVFLACLSDLVVCVVARLGGNARDAQALYEDAARTALDTLPHHDFALRAATVDWSAPPEDAFTDSPKVLAQAAPVSDAFRSADREIIEASLRYRWIEVRRQIRQRLPENVQTTHFLEAE